MITCFDPSDGSYLLQESLYYAGKLCDECSQPRMYRGKATEHLLIFATYAPTPENRYRWFEHAGDFCSARCFKAHYNILHPRSMRKP